MNIGLGVLRKTILLIDGDAHARAALRMSLEAAGFTVGEAASGGEGERTARRIAPDAILAELMLETVDGGSLVAERLRAAGSRVPFYLVSTAGAALVGAMALHDVGVSGVFLKPVDAAIVIRTLQTRLGLIRRDARESPAHA